MKVNIVFLDADTIGKTDKLEQIKTLGSYKQYGLTPPDQIIERVRGNEIIITNKVIIDREVMDECRELKLICIAATGMNNVDLDYAEKRGISVRNAAGYSTESVAESAFSMLFYLMHSSRYYDDYVKNGEYSESPIFTHHGRPFRELKGMRFGIIGLGTIGKRVAEIASCFGSEVCFYSTSGRNSNSQYTQVSLVELLKSSDVVSIHCPLNEHTLNLIGAKELKMMKTSAYLLNLGRGGIVHEEALSEALEKEQIAGAGIDVLTAEPIRKDNPLMQCKKSDRLFITPHIAWTSEEARSGLVDQVVDNIREFLRNKSEQKDPGQ